MHIPSGRSAYPGVGALLIDFGGNISLNDKAVERNALVSFVRVVMLNDQPE